MALAAANIRWPSTTWRERAAYNAVRARGGVTEEKEKKKQQKAARAWREKAYILFISTLEEHYLSKKNRRMAAALASLMFNKKALSPSKTTGHSDRRKQLSIKAQHTTLFK